MVIVGIGVVIASLGMLYLKYRVVFTGEKCKGKIIGITDKNAGYCSRRSFCKKACIYSEN